MIGEKYYEEYYDLFVKQMSSILKDYELENDDILALAGEVINNVLQDKKYSSELVEECVKGFRNNFYPYDMFETIVIEAQQELFDSSSEGDVTVNTGLFLCYSCNPEEVHSLGCFFNLNPKLFEKGTFKVRNMICSSLAIKEEFVRRFEKEYLMH